MPETTAAKREASSFESERIGPLPRVAAFFTLTAELEGIRPSSTARLSAVERIACITPTVLGLTEWRERKLQWV